MLSNGVKSSTPLNGSLSLAATKQVAPVESTMLAPSGKKTQKNGLVRKSIDESEDEGAKVGVKVADIIGKHQLNLLYFGVNWFFF